MRPHLQADEQDENDRYVEEDGSDSDLGLAEINGVGDEEQSSQTADRRGNDEDPSFPLLLLRLFGVFTDGEKESGEPPPE